ncbi:MAG: hypothetical protein EBX40_01105 [Gammaproteobacteria bacterium]|nr:hypothetical protein [Gammaproteobacteria bacterium]
MAKELAVFREIPNSVDIVLSGDEMRPHFRAGDIVGGVKLSNFSEAIGEICIVQSTEGEILLRLLQVGNSPNNFTLLTLQPLAGGASPLVTPGVELSMVARVVWHRRPL